MRGATVDACRAHRPYVLGDLPFVEKADAVGDVHGAQQVVGDHEHGHPLCAQACQQRVEVGSRLGIQSRGGLVEQERRHLARHCQPDRDLLAHALGEAAHPAVVRRGIEPGGGQGVADARVAIPLACEVEQVGHVLPRAQVLVQRHVLGNVGKLPSRLRRLDGGIGPLHAHRSRLRPQEAEEQVQRSGLAGAVRAEQRVDLPGVNREIEPAQDGSV